MNNLRNGWISWQNMNNTRNDIYGLYGCELFFNMFYLKNFWVSQSMIYGCFYPFFCSFFPPTTTERHIYKQFQYFSQRLLLINSNDSCQPYFVRSQREIKSSSFFFDVGEFSLAINSSLLVGNKVKTESK